MLLSLAALSQSCGARREAIDLGANDGRGIAVLQQLPAVRSLLTAVSAFEMNEGFASPLRAILTTLPGGQFQQAAAWTHERGVDANIQLPGASTARSSRGHSGMRVACLVRLRSGGGMRLP